MPLSQNLAHHRARVGALSRDRAPDDPEFIAAKRDLAAAKIAEYVSRVVTAAPPLTDEQRTKLAELLRLVRATSAAAARHVGEPYIDRHGRELRRPSSQDT